MIKTHQIIKHKENSSYDLEDQKNMTQSEKLLFYYNKAKESPNHKKYDSLFFENFPNSFIEMKKIFGFYNNKQGNLYYNEELGEKLIDYFSNLDDISKDKYYTKYINICINGKYEGDLIRDGFGIENKIFDDAKNFIPILNKFTDNEIISVFKFIFDGEPKPTKNYLDDLYNRINPINHRVAKLMKKAFELRIELKH